MYHRGIFLRLNPCIWVVMMMITATVHEAVGQNAVEVRRNGAVPYPAIWPGGPGRDSLPSWAIPGAIRFSRWDGGRIETAKAFLSGWPGLNPPDPNILYTMTNWYDPKTVHFITDARINLIWVTLSVGFSNETEEKHRDEVRRYIAECHRNGIHVMAYESIGNIFWEDMFQAAPESKAWLAKDKDGKPVPYSAGTYQKMGRITRYMADFSNTQWRAYLLKRIDLAIDSGADGLIYDNNFGSTLFELYPLLFQHAAKRKKDFLMMANFHSDTYVLNRLLNCITTEDGLEPGLYSSSSPGYADIKSGHPYLLPVQGKFLVNNIGLLRTHETLSEGWKPVFIEDGRREHAERMVGFMSAARSQLALAENMMFGIAEEQYVEARPAYQLATGDAGALATWKAIGKYNQFFKDHQELYTGARSQAPLAILLDDHSDGVALLDGLAARRVLFKVIYDRDVTAKTLSPYKAVAILTARSVRNSALSAMKDFVGQGGRLIVAQQAASLDENGAQRVRPAFFNGHLGKGESTYFENLPAINELVGSLLAASGQPSIRLKAPPGVLYNITEQPETKRTLIHILNYTLDPVTDLELQVNDTVHDVRIISPDGDESEKPLTGLTSRDGRFIIPRLQTYSIVVLNHQ